MKIIGKIIAILLIIIGSFITLIFGFFILIATSRGMISDIIVFVLFGITPILGGAFILRQQKKEEKVNVFSQNESSGDTTSGTMQKNVVQSTLQRNESVSQTVETEKSFYLLVDDVHVSIGRGTVAIGHVQGGSIKYHDTAYLIKNNGEIINTMILGICSTQTLDSFKQNVAEVGEIVGLLLRGIFQEDINEGDFI